MHCVFSFQPSLSGPLTNVSVDVPSQETAPPNVLLDMDRPRPIPNIMHSAAPECQFAVAQPGEHHFDVQVCHCMYTATQGVVQCS